MSIMNSYSETKFLCDFMDIYNLENEYDFTILFDDYYYQFISTNSIDFLKNVFHFI